MSELAYRCLMEAHDLNQDRSVALQTFEECRIMLADELDVSLDEATLCLAERVQSGNNITPTGKGDDQIRHAKTHSFLLATWRPGVRSIPNNS